MLERIVTLNGRHRAATQKAGLPFGKVLKAWNACDMKKEIDLNDKLLWQWDTFCTQLESYPDGFKEQWEDLDVKPPVFTTLNSAPTMKLKGHFESGELDKVIQATRPEKLYDAFQLFIQQCKQALTK